MTLRNELIGLALQPGANKKLLAERFGVSRKTLYKWLERHQKKGVEGLADLSRRPQTSPERLAPNLESKILAVRKEYPHWGARKILKVLSVRGVDCRAAASTVHAVLLRHGCVLPSESPKHRAWQRFERPVPNDLWQMDFKGHFPAGPQQCHALGILDDHSRYCLNLTACSNERATTVKERLEQTFRRYGLPNSMLMDNGSPWGAPATQDNLTSLTLWLWRLGIQVLHGRAYHPQTQGKQERFFGTLQREVLAGRLWKNLEQCQERFDHWRPIYNSLRPHEACGMNPPSARYQPSPRPLPSVLPKIEYDSAELVRKVDTRGQIGYKNRHWMITAALAGQQVALRPSSRPGFHLDVCYGAIPIKSLNLDSSSSMP